MILKELVTVLGFDIDHKSLKELDESFEALKLGVESLILSVGGAVAGIYEVVHATGEAGEKIKLLSERTGIGVESLQGLQYAAHLANVSSDELTQTLGFLNRSLFAAKHGGGEAMTAFQRLGIGMNQLQNLKADDAFGLIADSMKKISDPTERAALATQIFGRAGQRLIPVLIKGSANLRALNEEAAAFGEFTEEDAENAAEYSESVKRLGAVFDGLKRAVGIGFLQPFKQAADAAREFVLANRAIIKENLDGFIKALTEYLQRAFTVFKAVGHSVWGFPLRVRPGRSRSGRQASGGY